MLTCGCGRWMHTEGIEERAYEDGAAQWFIRSECRGCGFKVGMDVPAGQHMFIDRLMWTDEALHRLQDAVNERALGVTFLGVYPFWDDLRGSPEFRKILSQVHLLDVSDRIRR